MNQCTLQNASKKLVHLYKLLIRSSYIVTFILSLSGQTIVGIYAFYLQKLRREKEREKRGIREKSVAIQRLSVFPTIFRSIVYG